MSLTYRAFVAAGNGQLKLTTKPVNPLEEHEVRIEVDACGMCGADISDIANAAKETQRVPGHEVTGRIIETGRSVPPIWRTGQRVGVGRFGGYCQWCSPCRHGDFHLCEFRPVLGVTRDGGYAEQVTVPATGLVAIPDSLSPVTAAPLLCAGLATFNGLCNSGAAPGDTVAILGIGGLGHMAIQYGRKMGFRVVALGRGSDIRNDALTLGAHRYIDLNETEIHDIPVFSAILSTIGDAEVLSALAGKLKPRGKLIIQGISKTPLTVPTGYLVSGERQIAGSITGIPAESESVLDFSVMTGALPGYKVFPFEQAPKALEYLHSGKAKFRVVLSMGSN